LALELLITSLKISNFNAKAGKKPNRRNKEMRKQMVTLLAGAMLMMATSAMATPFNDRPISPLGQWIAGSNTEPTLQTVFNNSISGGNVDAIQDQNQAAIWTQAEGDVSTYLVRILTGGNGKLGIYSYTDPSKFAYLTGSLTSGTPIPTNTTGASVKGFDISDSGTLVVDGALTPGFGAAFGFFWETGTTKFYTEDSKNGSVSYSSLLPSALNTQARALTYLLEDNMKVKTYGAAGLSTKTVHDNNDWILAFEDGSDGDFNDAIFLVEDMSAVPEPGTMMLLGMGMLGLAVYGKRRMNKEA
jgi:hypothetical protein